MRADYLASLGTRGLEKNVVSERTELPAELFRLGPEVGSGARRGPGLPFPPLSDPAGRLNTFLENTETGRDSTTSKSFSSADLKDKIELLEHCGTLKFAEWNPRSLVSTEKLIASLRIYASIYLFSFDIGWIVSSAYTLYYFQCTFILTLLDEPQWRFRKKNRYY